MERREKRNRDRNKAGHATNQKSLADGQGHRFGGWGPLYDWARAIILNNHDFSQFLIIKNFPLPSDLPTFIPTDSASYKRERNKAGYTATSCGWAGAEMQLSFTKNVLKRLFSHLLTRADGQTDQPMDRQTDGRTDKASY